MGAEEQFMAAFIHFLEKGEVKQADIARATDTAPQTINSIVKNNKAPNLQKQEKIADACGFTYIDFLEKGRSILAGDDKKNKTEDYTSRGDILTSVALWTDQYQKVKDMLGFWRQVFDLLPVPALIIKDRIVINQNQKSLALGRLAGVAVCDNCANTGCDDRKNCPIMIAVESGIATSGYQKLGGKMHKIEAAPFGWNNLEYFIVTATERMDETGVVAEIK